MDGVYRCLWCNELFVERVPTAIAGNILPQYHDPCPKANEVWNLDLSLHTDSVKGAALLVAVVKEK